MPTSIHDHHISEIVIDASKRSIRLRTVNLHSTRPDRALVAFDGVEAYVFHGDALGTILFDIEVVDPLTLYRDYAEELTQAHDAHGGHAPWVISETTAHALFVDKSVRGYRISSSIGLDGAVWARDMSIVDA